MLAALHRVALDLGDVIVANSSADWGIDAVVSGRNRTVGVEVKRAKRDQVIASLAIDWTKQALRRGHPAGVVLIVSNAVPSKNAIEKVRRVSDRVRFVNWRSDDDDVVLSAEIQDALDEGTS